VTRGSGCGVLERGDRKGFVVCPSWAILAVEKSGKLPIPFESLAWFLDASPESAFWLFVNVDRDHLVCIFQGTQCLQDICEVCGQPGKLPEDGWIKTLCDEHASVMGGEQHG
jgi:hypothetical protein